MIIVEDAKLLNVDHAAGPGPSNAHFGPVHAPPPTPPSPHPRYHGYSYQSVPVVVAVPPTRTAQSPVARFWKAFAFALLIYLAFLTSVRSIIHMASGIYSNDGSTAGPRPGDGHILQQITSANWTTYHPRPRWAPSFPLSAEASFVLPIAAAELYLFARGSYQHGAVHIRQSELGEGERDQVTVDVRVAYHDTRALGRASVCRLRRSGNGHGVGIYTPTSVWTDVRDRLYFEVVITLPAAPSETSPLRVARLTTDASNFAHDVGDLWRSAWFDTIDLGSSNAAIQVDSVTLTKGSITSSNGAIIGHFNASDVLMLRTSNAQIQVTASLFSTHRDAAKLDMRTSNGKITSSVFLTTETGAGGNFVVKARTSNGEVKLQYDDMPLEVQLASEVRTSNSRARVVMHPAFEGTYDVSTSNARPSVVDTHPVDPSGAGRRRIVEQRAMSRSEVAGRVYWTGLRRAEGTCTVQTSNGQASLEI